MRLFVIIITIKMDRTQWIAILGNFNINSAQEIEESECSETNDFFIPKKVLNQKEVKSESKNDKQRPESKIENKNKIKFKSQRILKVIWKKRMIKFRRKNENNRN